MKLTSRIFRLSLGLWLCLAHSGAAGQAPEQSADLVKARALMTQPQVVAAFASVDKDRDRILHEWIAITEINAPSGHERERAAYLEKILRGYKLANIHYDAAGNLIAV